MCGYIRERIDQRRRVSGAALPAFDTECLDEQRAPPAARAGSARDATEQRQRSSSRPENREATSTVTATPGAASISDAATNPVSKQRY
jgi:hypothetical protein